MPVYVYLEVERLSRKWRKIGLIQACHRWTRELRTMRRREPIAGTPAISCRVNLHQVNQNCSWRRNVYRKACFHERREMHKGRGEGDVETALIGRNSVKPEDLAQITRPKLMFISMTLRNSLRSLLSSRGPAKWCQTSYNKEMAGWQR